MQLNINNPPVMSTMSSNSIRKKHSFFDGGRGVPQLEKDSGSVTHSDDSCCGSSLSCTQTPDDRYVSPDPQPEDFSYTPPVVYAAAPVALAPPNVHSSTESLLGTTASTLTTGYGSYGDLHSPYSYEVSPGPSAFVETPAYAAAQARLQLATSTSIASSSVVSSSSRFEDETSYVDRHRQEKKRKRPQKCRMCANHGKQADVKGHKWLCPYRECKCENCHITRKTQYYMKERQKFVRKQQQEQLPSLAMTLENCKVNDADSLQRRRTIPSDSMEFPRRQELITETADIIEPDLFAKINEVCRPKSNYRPRLVNNSHRTITKEPSGDNFQSYRMN